MKITSSPLLTFNLKSGPLGRVLMWLRCTWLARAKRAYRCPNFEIKVNKHGNRIVYFQTQVKRKEQLVFNDISNIKQIFI